MAYGERHIISNMWNEKFKNEVKKQYKISFCTVCMDRLHNLKETLPINIKSNKSYPNLEFVILDYNSSDKLEDWIKNNFIKYINNGRIVYYRTEEPKYFDMPHAKNVVSKLASGDIINNLDADNYAVDIRPENKNKQTNECWASYLNRIANEFPEKAIFIKSNRVPHGRVGFYKKDFIDILGGYDEELAGYGYEDFDIVERAIRLNFVFCPFGRYYTRIYTYGTEKNKNLKKDWKETKEINLKKSAKNIRKKIFKANQEKHWGKATLIKNFKEEIKI